MSNSAQQITMKKKTNSRVISQAQIYVCLEKNRQLLDLNEDWRMRTKN